MESLRDLDLFGGEYFPEHCVVAVLDRFGNPGPGYSGFKPALCCVIFSSVTDTQRDKHQHLF